MIKFLLQNKYIFLTTFILFCCVEVAIYFSVNYMKELDTKSFLQHKTKELNIQVETGKHYLNLLAEVLHTNVLNNSINADIMYEASHTNDLKKQAQLRAKLYQTYITKYEYMKTLGVRQLHFHVLENLLCM